MKKRGIAQNSLLALMGDVASKAGALAVILIAARALEVGEFALLATGLASAALLAAMLDLGAGTLLTRDGARSTSTRGGLFRALVQARAPLAVAVLVVAPFVGLALGRTLIAVAVAALAISSALTLSVLGLYRAGQDIRPEALQRLGCAFLSVALVALCCLFRPRADAIVAVLALSTLATLLPLGAHVRRVADFRLRISPLAALRRAAPIGLLALATVAYYRSGTLALAAFAGANETAVFTVAASVAFGLLMLPNAITTALLPRLSAEVELAGFIASARRALAWTIALAVLVSVAAAAAGPWALPRVFGPEYASAEAPFALLCLGLPVIAASGVIGTALLSLGHVRSLVVQVACTLAVNLLALALLVPSMGAVGAALATIACEVVGLVLLVRMARRALPSLIDVRPLETRTRIEASGAATP